VTRKKRDSSSSNDDIYHVPRKIARHPGKKLGKEDVGYLTDVLVESCIEAPGASYLGKLEVNPHQISFCRYIMVDLRVGKISVVEAMELCKQRCMEEGFITKVEKHAEEETIQHLTHIGVMMGVLKKP
jgi:hypothetical protein